MKNLLLVSLLMTSAVLFAQTEKLLNQADNEFSKGKYEECVVTYGQVIEADPENLNAFIQRGLALSILGKYSESVADFTHVLNERPELTAVRNSRGTAYMKLKSYDQAISDFDAVLTADNQNQEAYNNRGWCKKHKGDDKGACDDWKQSKKLGNGEAKIILKNNGC